MIIAAVSLVGMLVVAILNAMQASQGKTSILRLLPFLIFAGMMIANIIIMPEDIPFLKRKTEEPEEVNLSAPEPGGVGNGTLEPAPAPPAESAPELEAGADELSGTGETDTAETGTATESGAAETGTAADTGTETAGTASSETGSASGSADGLSSGTLGSYYVTIKDAKLADDYDGNPAIVITYHWQNNSEDTISALTALRPRAFQDGVQMDSAIIGNNNICDTDSTWRNIRPGSSTNVQVAYKLRSNTAPVEFELQEFLSRSDEMVTKTFDVSTL